MGLLVTSFAWKRKDISKSPICSWAVNIDYMSKFLEPRGILEILKANIVLLFVFFQNHRFHETSKYFFILVFASQDTFGIEQTWRLWILISSFSIGESVQNKYME